MIERARARQCYDELVVAEVTAFLSQQRHGLDVVISADTLIYFGALEPVFATASDSLRGAGWLIFTLEALDPSVTEDYRLEFHGRYAHSESYVRRALATAGFRIDTLTRETFRAERDQQVPGFLIIARKGA
jgi:predicted TPR repeat methyltransferase